MEIKFLADCQHHLNTVASWAFHEWHELYPDETLDDVIGDYKEYLDPNKIPFAIVAVENDTLIGTACCVMDDELPGYDHLSPWLAAVYVDPSHRKHGAGKKLVDFIIANAKKIGVKTMYLWTDAAKDWYIPQGWIEIETTEFKGHKVSVMKLDI